MKSVGYKVLVKELQIENKTGLYLGKQVADGVIRGTVLSVGDGVKVKVNEQDIIQFKKSTATNILVNGEELWSVDEGGILIIE